MTRMNRKHCKWECSGFACTFICSVNKKFDRPDPMQKIGAVEKWNYMPSGSVMPSMFRSK